MTSFYLMFYPGRYLSKTSFPNYHGVSSIVKMSNLNLLHTSRKVMKCVGLSLRLAKFQNYVGGIHGSKFFEYRNKAEWRLVSGRKSVSGEMRGCRGEVLVRVKFYLG